MPHFATSSIRGESVFPYVVIEYSTVIGLVFRTFRLTRLFISKSCSSFESILVPIPLISLNKSIKPNVLPSISVPKIWNFHFPDNKLMASLIACILTWQTGVWLTNALFFIDFNFMQSAAKLKINRVVSKRKVLSKRKPVAHICLMYPIFINLKQNFNAILLKSH